MMENKLHPCSCCGQNPIGELGDYEICLVCEWEDESVLSDDPKFVGGVNSPSINEARKIYLNK